MCTLTFNMNASLTWATNITVLLGQWKCHHDTEKGWGCPSKEGSHRLQIHLLSASLDDVTSEVRQLFEVWVTWPHGLGHHLSQFHGSQGWWQPAITGQHINTGLDQTNGLQGGWTKTHKVKGHKNKGQVHSSIYGWVPYRYMRPAQRQCMSIIHHHENGSIDLVLRRATVVLVYVTVTATWLMLLIYMCFFSASCFHPVTVDLTATEDFTWLDTPSKNGVCIY